MRQLSLLRFLSFSVVITKHSTAQSGTAEIRPAPIASTQVRIFQTGLYDGILQPPGTPSLNAQTQHFEMSCISHLHDLLQLDFEFETLTGQRMVQIHSHHVIGEGFHPTDVFTTGHILHNDLSALRHLPPPSQLAALPCPHHARQIPVLERGE